MASEHERMEFDCVVVGAGPSGLSAAIRLKQLKPDLSVCVLEKGSEVGAHILSGAVFEPRSLNELIPDWKAKGAPLHTEAKDDNFLYLTEQRSFRLPTPPTMHNAGNYIISLGNFCRWLATQAESLGVEIFAGFAAAEVLYDGDRVIGFATGDMGIGKDGQPTGGYTPGVELVARQTIIAEGCRGSLTRLLAERFGLRDACDPQVYGIGFKELWEVDPTKHQQGKILHTIGWPLESDTYGGSFCYHIENNQVVVGLVVGLDYANPHLSPFEEFQRFKTHPLIRPLLEGGRRLSYGARAISAGGFQAIPKLTFPGGVLVGDTAGFLNVPKLKGSHTAMKSGMLAAEAVVEALESGEAEAARYPEKIKQSWLWQELYEVRNIKPAFKWGLFPALAYSALDTYLFRGRAPWTFHHKPDHLRLKPVTECQPIAYPKPDGKLTFDRLSSVFVSNTNHAENQPAHLKLKDLSVPIAINLQRFDAPEQRYCPAGVYEIVEGPEFRINAQNCIHCKTCDIKDPTQNIVWTVPEGGGGPNYPNM